MMNCFLKKNKTLRFKPVKELIKIQTHHTKVTKIARIRALLVGNLRLSFKNFLKDNVDVFA